MILPQNLNTVFRAIGRNDNTHLLRWPSYTYHDILLTEVNVGHRRQFLPNTVWAVVDCFNNLTGSYYTYIKYLDPCHSKSVSTLFTFLIYTFSNFLYLYSKSICEQDIYSLRLTKYCVNYRHTYKHKILSIESFWLLINFKIKNIKERLS